MHFTRQLVDCVLLRQRGGLLYGTHHGGVENAVGVGDGGTMEIEQESCGGRVCERLGSQSVIVEHCWLHSARPILPPSKSAPDLLITRSCLADIIEHRVKAVGYPTPPMHKVAKVYLLE